MKPLIYAACFCSAIFAANLMAAGPEPETSFSDGVSSMDIASVRGELMAFPPDIVQRVSNDQMAKLISNMLVDKRMLQAANKAGVQEQSEVKSKIAFAKASEAKLPDLDGLAKERYETNKSAYSRPEAIRVAHILIKLNPVYGKDDAAADAAAKAKAEKLLEEIKAGADFSELAKKNSDDSRSALNGGELDGWAEKGRFVAPFEEAAFALKPGELSGLVKTQFGYHIIKVLEHRDAGIAPFSDVKEGIKAKIRQELLAAQKAEFLKQFKGSKDIVINDDTMKALKAHWPGTK
jgi:parvulin-like peptidyl-prolyl isomerase